MTEETTTKVFLVMSLVMFPTQFSSELILPHTMTSFRTYKRNELEFLTLQSLFFRFPGILSDYWCAMKIKHFIPKAPNRVFSSKSELISGVITTISHPVVWCYRNRMSSQLWCLTFTILPPLSHTRRKQWLNHL